jgi:hypothetical protein
MGRGAATAFLNTSDVAMSARAMNWDLVRSAAADVGDAWDLEETAFELLCECGRAGCGNTVSVALVEYLEARASGHDLVTLYHEDPRDLVVRSTDDYKIVARTGMRHAASLEGRAAIGDWTCACGQHYRAAVRGSHMILWPRNSATGFRQEPIDDRCVNGCPIDRLGVLEAVLGPPPS